MNEFLLGTFNPLHSSRDIIHRNTGEETLSKGLSFTSDDPGFIAAETTRRTNAPDEISNSDLLSPGSLSTGKRFFFKGISEEALFYTTIL